jgi:hypothetical protein
MKTQYIYLLLFSFFTLQLAGQGWRQTYHFPSNSYRVYSLAQHPDGGYLAATSASLTTSFNAAILKTTAEGDSVWLKSYPGGYGILLRRTPMAPSLLSPMSMSMSSILRAR